MDTVTTDQDHRQALRDSLASGEVIVYPTDTIYGIGCDATDESAVEQVRKAKQRPEKPVSVIAPSKAWITEHLDISESTLNRLPGPYTLIAEALEEGVAPNVAPGQTTLGVRRPDHWMTSVVESFGEPVVTTSVNISGQPHATSLEDISSHVRSHVDIAVDAGELDGGASTLLDCTGDTVTCVER